VQGCGCVDYLRQHEDMAIISAQQYYIDYGLDLTVDRLSSLLPSYLPDNYIESQKDISYWIQVWHAWSNMPVLPLLFRSAINVY